MTVRRALLAILALSCTASAYVLYSEPHLRAYLCPACSGFDEVAPRIYADSRASAAQIATALHSFATAEALVQQAYPDRAADPIWLMCLSGACGLDTVPRPRAITYMDRFVFVYPEGATPTIVAHELAHTELHARLGTSRRLLSQPVPTWFDEGLAVLLSQDPRYLDITNGEVTGCKTGNWPEPPADQRTFRRRAASEAVALYTASACLVIGWLADKGGVTAIPALLRDIRSGDMVVKRLSR